MAIAQMNWGRMRYSLDDTRMAEFARALAGVYQMAEDHAGFIWRIPDTEAASQLSALGFDDKTSATVSVWEDVASLRQYTFETLHGEFLKRSSEWFETVDGPQLVIWDVAHDAQPSFKEAFGRLDDLKQNGQDANAYGWPD